MMYALFFMGPRQALVLDVLKALFVFLVSGFTAGESLDGVEAMWCTPDQQIITSSGWDAHLKN